jgi:hypothetical protein
MPTAAVVISGGALSTLIAPIGSTVAIRTAPA